MFTSCFIFIIILPKLLWYIAYPLINLINTGEISKLTGIIFVVFFYKFMYVLQILLLIIFSIFTIKNKKLIILNKLYNNLLIPSIFLLTFFFIDYFIKYFCIRNINTNDYTLFYSLTKNFLPIYIIAIINTIRLKIQKAKSL